MLVFLNITHNPQSEGNVKKYQQDLLRLKE